ncbi:MULTISPECIES: hypothetical protein [Bordetella]|uniref:Uncharacterized protein n=3 Tax=Bordetella TaxID=517 RepID=A0AAN1RYB2_9BORD|nr:MULTISPECIES: hypothetical protein [Bordetella]AKQ56103.1 hypothetical protein ACR54_02789 [Bordetella hinzii]AKQ60635.1 hypothetical protein ACR55_02768 [Bordetella hinzii]ANY15861.1 hypothetical protein BBN53_08095 [Bordetella pseudohinzii]AZW18332.1 hypothetical protein CS347_16960 [Bordetella hinzii]KCB25678.1 hypothetical protein L543_1170 [Bordetella hinzii L60]
MTYVAVCSLLVILAIVGLVVKTWQSAGTEVAAKMSAALAGSTYAFLLIIPLGFLLVSSLE